MHSETTVIKSQIDYKLEGLRGICALMVAIAHFFSFNFYESAVNAASVSSFVMHTQFAHVAVLIFITLSGYLIANKHFWEPFNRDRVKSYAKKRFIRIYPIYVLALLIPITLDPFGLPTEQILGHLLFLQDLYVKTLASNPPLWSLSYEVIYYGLFILLWAGSKILKKCTFLLFLTLGSITLLFFNVHLHSSLWIGWLFWILGSSISFLQKQYDKVENNKVHILSYLFVLLSVINLESGGFFMRLLHIFDSAEQQISLKDLIYLPVCSLLILVITGRVFRWLSFLKVTVFLIPAINILFLFYFKHDIANKINWIYGIAYFLISILLLTLKINISFLERFKLLGKLSYSIYIFHFPIGFYSSIYLSQHLSGIPLLLSGTILYILFTWSISYITEVMVQNKINLLFFK